MRIDPKYFNRFVFIAALFGAALIVLFTFWNQESREDIFKRRLEMKADSIRSIYFQNISGNDSVQIQQYENKWVVLDFWSTWAPQSRQSHRILNRLKKRHPNKIEIISAASQDPVNEIKSYIKKHGYPFTFVRARALYRDVNPPGVPTQIVYSPDGKVTFVWVGYRDSKQYDEFEKILN